MSGQGDGFPAGGRVVEGYLQAVERRPAANRRRSRPERPAAPAIALTLALAHWIDRQIESGQLADQSEAAKRFGLSSARISQIIDLTLLPPVVQQVLLHDQAAKEVPTERSLRDLSPLDLWPRTSGAAAA